ncbi:MAG: hypothetical protein Q9170_003762 [Blastenia crenularia]
MVEPLRVPGLRPGRICFIALALISVGDVDALEEARPAKKRRKAHHQNTKDSTALHADDDTMEKKKKKRKIAKDALCPTGSQPGADKQAVNDARHTTILSKYQKSVSTLEEAAPVPPSSPPSQTYGLIPLPQPPQVPDAPPVTDVSALPEWLSKPLVASEAQPVPFDSLGLNQSAVDSLKAKGLTEAFTIQAAVLPLLLPGNRQHHGDLCISASTGSGKTLAYALPLVEALRDKPTTRLRGLIVVPTKKLVNQTREALELCSSGSGLKIGTAYGNKSLREEQEILITREQRYDQDAYNQEQNKVVDDDEELLRPWDADDILREYQKTEDRMAGYVDYYASNIDILICTPGRLIEHLQHTRGFSLDHVQWLIVDEADRLLDETFQQWVEIVVPALEYQSPPSAAELQAMQRFHLLRNRTVRKILLSATMTRDISKLGKLKLRRPKLVVLQDEQKMHIEGYTENQAARFESSGQIRMPPSLQEVAVQIKDEENKPLYLVELLKKISSKHWWSSNRESRVKVNGKRKLKTSEGISLSPDPNLSSSSPPSSESSLSISSLSESNSDEPHSHPQPGFSTQQVHGSLIFAHSTSSAHRLSRLLSILSPDLASTSAILTKLSDKSSRKILSQFRTGQINVIISTDSASRGLNIPDLAHVINYDMPPSVGSYVHRVGRTARAGKAGTATTLVGWREGRWFWNEIGRGQGIGRSTKVTRQTLKEYGWTEEELGQYAEALKQLGEEARAR